MNKFLLKGVAAMLCMATMFGNVACSDDNDDPAKVSVTAVALDKTTLSLKPAATAKLAVTITPSEATTKTVTWTSSDDKVATVSDGTVTAVAVGTATITVKTDDGGLTASCAVTVSEDAPEGKDVVLQGEIKSDMTLKAIDNNLLSGFVYVTDGVTLTIEPGTVIKGEKATEGSLIVEPGGKIIAEGTVEKPIVFTSDQPAGSRTYGDWGGLILCGNAPVNATTKPQIEGGPRTTYGGNKPEDNSGIVKYVRIEFAGYPLEPNKEINGLTLGGVGRGTTLEYIQVSYCGDDSFEWFGGTVNAKHLIAYKGWDDEFDTDYGYSGKLQFLLGVRDPKVADTSKSNGFESDNDANGSGNEPLTKPIFSNVTLIGPFYGESAGKAESEILYTTDDAANGAKGGQFQAAMHIRRNSALNVYNSVFTGWPYGLYLQGANAGATVKNVIFAGMWENFKDDASKSYFETTGLNNQVYASSNDLIAKNADYSSVVVDKIGGAEFSDAVLSDSFFDKVTYKGAFDGTNDWTAGWANWDPQNTAY
ncbi:MULTISPECIES: Ig-like domain-containing protein [Parabacteroides]|uniref:Ig-like domain-containing protein n=1 Tax=Parabacteroides leei TaxID=2939491 RepID=UPI00189B55C1|nr:MULTISPECIES: Ig-like domain-containing protein [Parabacteroides]MCL3851393.1 Ig-like domain-containing protein [Parabacteroides leei]